MIKKQLYELNDISIGQGYVLRNIINRESVLPKGRSSAANSGHKAAALPGIE